jgi:two-component system NarL family response regulator
VDVLWAEQSDSLLTQPRVTEEAMGIGVIVCDDHPAFARGLAALLEQEVPEIEGARVATSAEELQRLVQEAPVDVVLMDLRMPGVGGIEATRKVRAVAPSTKVVVLTASDEQSDLYKALRAGASGYVLKEADVSEIAAAVRSVHRGHLVIPAHLVGDFMHDLEESDPESLTDAERDILAGIAQGETNREIGERLHMSERTVRRRVEDIYAKLHVTDRLQAAMYAAERGLSGRGGGR